MKKLKEKIGTIIAWWFVGGFIFGFIGAVVMWAIGVEGIVIAYFVVFAIVLPILAGSIWFGLIEKDTDLELGLSGKRSPV